MFRRASSSGRKILLTCIVTGLVVALLVSTLQFFMSYHNREVKYQTLASDIQHHVENHFAELSSTAQALQPLIANSCQQVAAKLTASAAFTMNIRAFLLVKEGIAYCSSATGSMDSPIQSLIPDLDISKKLDMVLQSGTPMMPNKPAIMMWYLNPSLQRSGVFASEYQPGALSALYGPTG